MPTYTITQFKAKASKILNSLEAGDEVIITRRGKPCGKLTAMQEPDAEKRSPRSLMGILATPDTPDWDYEELQGHIREIRDAWKASTYALLEEDAG